MLQHSTSGSEYTFIHEIWRSKDMACWGICMGAASSGVACATCVAGPRAGKKGTCNTTIGSNKQVGSESDHNGGQLETLGLYGEDCGHFENNKRSMDHSSQSVYLIAAIGMSMVFAAPRTMPVLLGLEPCVHQIVLCSPSGGAMLQRHWTRIRPGASLRGRFLGNANHTLMRRAPCSSS